MKVSRWPQAFPPTVSSATHYSRNKSLRVTVSQVAGNFLLQLAARKAGVFAWEPRLSWTLQNYPKAFPQADEFFQAPHMKINSFLLRTARCTETKFVLSFTMKLLKLLKKKPYKITLL